MFTLLFRRVSMFIVLIVAASLMVFVTGVMAQTATSDETEITGVLESITSDSIVVSGQTISIVDAEIKAMLVIGGTVKVHVSEVNGVLTAREVEGAPPSDDNSNANDNSNTNENLNDNSDDNTNDNADDNSNGNTNDNADDNSNDNTNLTPAISAQDAIEAVLQVYPTTTIQSVELTTKFGDTLVWEIKIRNRIEVTIDAQSGAILTIDRRSGDDSQNGNQNGNSNDNSDDNGNDNSDDNGNDNSDDNGNDNSDDNGGMGSDDSGGDDNGGMG